MTVPTGAPLAQNPGSTTKNGNEAGWQPRAFIHPGLVFCPVCLLGLPFEVLSAEGWQPGRLREAGVAQPGEVVCVVDGCSVPRGRHAPGNPDAVRAGLGGDIFPQLSRIFGEHQGVFLLLWVPPCVPSAFLLPGRGGF